MNDRDALEYTALRDTIRSRGTARVWVFLAGIALWAGAVLATLALGPIPATSLVPLVVLGASFEAVFALHAGVERIGRYLQVFFGDRWEETAMAFGPPLAGTGSDPLFAVYFIFAALLNVGPITVAQPVPAEWAVLGAAHALFIARVLYARQASSRQRAADLERFTLLHRR